MKRSLAVWQWLGFLFVSVAGTALHYVYEWTGESVFAAPFSGVNESTWEHMKLLFFPMLVFALIQGYYLRECKTFWCVKAIGAVVGILAIPFLFYTVNGAFGRTPDWVNISLFFVSAGLAFLLEYCLFRKELPKCKHQGWGILVLGVLALAFAIFTFATPEIPLFRDPVTGTYGVG